MKITKSHKIVILFTAFVMSLAAAFGLMNFTTASADTPAVKTYFKTNASNAAFTSTGLVLTGVANDNTLTFKNSIVLNNLTFEMVLPENATTTISFKADSYYVNGNKKVENAGQQNEKVTFETEIVNTIELKRTGSTVECKVNGVDLSGFALTDNELNLGVADNYLTVNGQKPSTSAYYKLRNIDNRIVAKDVEFKFTEVTGTPNFTLVSVNQNRDATGYKQELNATAVADKDNFATPRVVLDSSVYTRDKYDANKYVINRIATISYETISYTVYPVLGSVTDVKLIEIEKVELGLKTETKDAKNSIFFNEAGEAKFGVGNDEKTFEEFTANVAAFDTEDTAAPVFINDDMAIESFKAALAKKVVKEHDGTTTSVHLGAQIELPSYEDLVYDDYVPYKKLTKTVHYFTPTQHSDSSSLKITVSEVGNYMFVATFSDGTNAIKEKDVFEEKKDGTIDYKQPWYENLFFRFEIKDDAPISVTGAEEVAKGYKSIEYDATGLFTLEASGCTTTYTLYYNPNSDATGAEGEQGWIEIPNSKDLKESEYQGTFSYDEVMETAYDGKLSFVPTRVGAYQIKCMVTSDLSNRHDDASIIIKVVKPTTVHVYEWIQNNVWSVVFLSVGTLCLIGIIILLCIKPKDELAD